MYSSIIFNFSILNMKVDLNKSPWLSLYNIPKYEMSVSVKFLHIIKFMREGIKEEK